MRITKHGNTLIEHTCPKCFCMFEYSKGDIETCETQAYEPELDCFCKYEYFVVHCPECNEPITVSKDINKSKINLSKPTTNTNNFADSLEEKKVIALENIAKELRLSNIMSQESEFYDVEESDYKVMKNRYEYFKKKME